jgi:hypothetical protein
MSRRLPTVSISSAPSHERLFLLPFLGYSVWGLVTPENADATVYEARLGARAGREAKPDATPRPTGLYILTYLAVCA